MSLQEKLEAGARQLGIDLAPSTIEKLLAYLALLVKWNISKLPRKPWR